MENYESGRERLYPQGRKHEMSYRESLRLLGSPLATYSIDQIVLALETYCTPLMSEIVVRYILGQSTPDIVAQIDLKSTEDVNEAIRHSTYKLVEGFNTTLQRPSAPLSISNS